MTKKKENLNRTIFLINIKYLNINIENFIFETIIYKSELHIMHTLIQYKGFTLSLNILIMNYYI